MECLICKEYHDKIDREASEYICSKCLAQRPTEVNKLLGNDKASVGLRWFHKTYRPINTGHGDGEYARRFHLGHGNFL